jgi:pyruvate,water dikinase
MLTKTLGRKATVIREREGGGTVPVQQDAPGRQALPDAQVLALAQLGRRVVDLLGAPQDIEWATVGGELYLLQSRPITTLYPVPDAIPPKPLQILLSFAAVQGLLEPITPLGRDVFKSMLVGAARLFGYTFTLEEQPTLLEAGERMWINISGTLANRLGRRVTLAALEYVEPGSKQALLGLLRDDELPAPGNPHPRTVLRLLRALLPIMGRALRTLFAPDAQRDQLLESVEVWLAHARDELVSASSPTQRLALIRHVPENAFHFLLPRFVPRFGIGMAMYNLLTRLSAGFPDQQIDTRTMMRALPHNVTTEMDLALWQVAQAIRADPASLDHCTHVDASALADEYITKQLPEAAQSSIDGFLARYGMRGLGEIDLGRPRWRQDPTPLMQALQSYLQINDPSMAPDAVFERGRQNAEEEIERLVKAVRRAPGGRISARLVR